MIKVVFGTAVIVINIINLFWASPLSLAFGKCNGKLYSLSDFSATQSFLMDGGSDFKLTVWRFPFLYEVVEMYEIYGGRNNSFDIVCDDHNEETHVVSVSRFAEERHVTSILFTDGEKLRKYPWDIRQIQKNDSWYVVSREKSSEANAEWNDYIYTIYECNLD